MAIARFGPLAALLPAFALVALVLLVRPRAALAILLGTVVVLEADTAGFLPITAKFYNGLPSPTDLLFLVLIAGTILELARKREAPRWPRPFTGPLVLMGLAVVGGTAVGLASSDNVPSNVTSSVETLVYLVVLPFVVMNILHGSRQVRLMAGAAAGLAAFKGVEGCLGLLAGGGRGVGDSALTFYEPTANWLAVVFLLTVLAAVLLRVPLAWWVKVAVPLSAAALLFSYRRSFWIAAVLGLVLVLVLVLFAGGHRPRRFFLPLVGLVAVGAAVFFISGATKQGQGPVAQRAESLTPSKVSTNPQDRYRLDERRNVLAEIRSEPITGLGLGVPWKASSPLIIQNVGGRLYAHFTPLWFWLKLGLLGVIAYVWLIATAIYAAFKLWRTAADPLLQAIGVALTAGFIGLIVAETTASFTGVDYRFTIVLAAMFGWLAVALRSVREDAEIEQRAPI